MYQINGKYTNALITTTSVEESCIAQITQLVNHPSFTTPVAIMPDCHAGQGCVVGLTMPLGKSICPNIVGVDIGCGMLAAKYLSFPEMDRAKVDEIIRNLVPFGHNVHSSPIFALTESDHLFTQVQTGLDSMWAQLRNLFGSGVPAPPRVSFQWYQELCQKVGMNPSRAQASIGTLGGGNHFIELGTSKTSNPDPQAEDKEVTNYWIIVHSGSRQLGKTICDYHQDKAVKQQKDLVSGEYRKEVERIRQTTKPTRDIPKKIKEFRDRIGFISGVKAKGMESLEGDKMYEYLYDMTFAQYYASRNRMCILDNVEKAMKIGKPYELIETIHNYIDPRDLVVRKGAVASHVGEKLVIPFNMKDGTWICVGKGNEEWNNSAPHGAGRTMSRSDAKKILDQKEAEQEMKDADVYMSCTPLDETPGAYKSSWDIQTAINPTAGMIESVKPFMNLKAE